MAKKENSPINNQSKSTAKKTTSSPVKKAVITKKVVKNTSKSVAPQASKKVLVRKTEKKPTVKKTSVAKKTRTVARKSTVKQSSVKTAKPSDAVEKTETGCEVIGDLAENKDKDFEALSEMITPVVAPIEAAPIDADPTPASAMKNDLYLRDDIKENMSITMISSEMSPVIKVGGLADVVFGLSGELSRRGHNVEVILPKYDCMRMSEVDGLLPVYNDLWVPWYGDSVHCTVYEGDVHGRKCFFIEPHSADNFFDRGEYYGSHDDIFRFAFFSRAAVEYLYKAGKSPDVIHCHDWHTGLVPVMLYEIYQNIGLWHPRVCYTIHNFKHQGQTSMEVLNACGLAANHLMHPDRLQDNTYPHAINLMKGAIVYSNYVNTVSPHYAGEAKDQGMAYGLETTLHKYHDKFGGIVNGIDYDAWSPQTDLALPANYSATEVDKKYESKRLLRERLMMADNEKPIVAYIGRLDPQKGLDLVRHAIFYCINHGAQFVMLGSSPEASINDYFWSLKHHINDNVDSHIEVGFNEELARLIYAGADMMVVPSRFEPCGLTQLISMHYGTVPVVRSCGGLADTVFDKDFSDRPLDQRNGYSFIDADMPGLESALHRAICCYYDYPENFRELMLNGMNTDYSWNVPSQHYLNVYEHIRAK